MTTIKLTLKEIYDLAKNTLLFNGCDELNADSVASTVSKAERDGSISHGLFRIPGYVASLRSKKVNGKAMPKITELTQNIIRVHGDFGFVKRYTWCALFAACISAILGWFNAQLAVSRSWYCIKPAYWNRSGIGPSE